MATGEDLWSHERRLWLEGPQAFRRLMAPDCVMAFPGMGVISGPAIIEGLEGTPRWSDVEMAGRTRLDRDGAAVLAYLATARREQEGEYSAVCISTWVRDDGWQILAHQQTPL